MRLHRHPVVRIKTQTLEENNTNGIIKNVYIDTSADDIVLVTTRNTVLFCRLSAMSKEEEENNKINNSSSNIDGNAAASSSEQPSSSTSTPPPPLEESMLDTLRLQPQRSTTSARRFVTRTSAKMHGGLCALTFNAEHLYIFNSNRSVSTPIGTFTCAPNSLRFRESWYPILRYEWLPQRVGSASYDTNRIYLAVACSICVELVQVFPLGSSPDTAIRKLQRFVTTTDFCGIDATSRRLSMLCLNQSRKGVLKFFVFNDPVAEAHHARQFTMNTQHASGAAGGEMEKQVSLTADTSSSSPSPQRGGAADASSSSSSKAIVTAGDPTIEHRLEIKIDEDPVEDPQYAFREMFPDPAQRKRGYNVFIKLITLYAEHYAAVVTRSEVVLYRYDTSIPFFAVRKEERPMRSFVLSLQQPDKYSLLVLDNEILMQSLNPPFLCFAYDTALDTSTNKLRDRELVECMRRVGGVGTGKSSGQQQSSSASAGTSQERSGSPVGGGAHSSILNPSMFASGPALMAHNASFLPTPALASSTDTSNINNPTSSPATVGAGASSSAASSSTSASVAHSGGVVANDSIDMSAGSSGGGGFFSRLFSLPTQHVEAHSSEVVSLSPHIPEPLENIPIPDLPGGGGIFCGCSEPIFLSLGTDFLRQLAAGGQTSIPPEHLANAKGKNVEVFLIAKTRRRDWLSANATSLAARGGSLGKENFGRAFAAAIENSRSLTDIEHLLDESASGFIVASCAIEPPVSNSGLRSNGRWALDHGAIASSKRVNPTQWATPMLSERDIQLAERAIPTTMQAFGVTLSRDGSPVPSSSDITSSTTATLEQQQQQQQQQEQQSTTSVADTIAKTASSSEKKIVMDIETERGRRGRLESCVPLVVAGVGQDTLAPAAHLQLVIADVLSHHIALVAEAETVDSRRLRYLRGVALEVLRCFRCLIIAPLQQTIVESFVCGGSDHMDLWGLLQLISFRFLAESPALASKLIEVGVHVRLRQLVQAGLDMLGRLGAFYDLATALLQLGDLLAAVRVAVKHELRGVAASALVQAHALDLEFSCEGKLCFSAATRRKLFPLISAMLRTKNDVFASVVDSTLQRITS